MLTVGPHDDLLVLAESCGYEGNGYLGVDIGLHGAMALLDEDGKALLVADMPVYYAAKGKTEGTFRDQPNWHLIQLFLELLLGEYRPLQMLVELNGPYHKDGKMGWRLNGLQFGYWRAWGGAYGPSGLQFAECMAQDWKPEFKLIGKGKDASRQAALKLYPDAPVHRVKDDGRAEALLIANYHYRWHGHQLTEDRYTPAKRKRKR